MYCAFYPENITVRPFTVFISFRVSWPVQYDGFVKKHLSIYMSMDIFLIWI